MNDTRFLHKDHYEESWALVIGIDRYAHVSPLGYAVSDARAMRDILVHRFGFPPKNVTLLENEAATKANIAREFSRFTNDGTCLDDRIVMFFAGHGHTMTGQRGEVGFLVPQDADMTDLSTLMRWDELTRNAELVRAKHLWFIMDACYGGLAVTRKAGAGAARFLKDMHRRRACQVLTAGKADEVVADSGGPIPHHSIFTGHLLQGLEGEAVTPEGYITASGVMAYVYGKVGNDQHSNQTPHFGHLDGDGDMVLSGPPAVQEETEGTTADTLVTIPFGEELTDNGSLRVKIGKVKAALSSTAGSIELHDLLVAEVRRFQSATSTLHFNPSSQHSKDEVLHRLEHYESAARDLSLMLACVAHWGHELDRASFDKAFARSVDTLEHAGGLNTWLMLRRFPLLLIFYTAGIAAVTAGRYDWLRRLFDCMVEMSQTSSNRGKLVEFSSDTVLEFNRSSLFKEIPSYENLKVPVSEYLFKLVQPGLDDTFFLGKSYENTFDHFEVLFCLAAIDAELQRGEHGWGPLGRFSYKGSHTRGPYRMLVQEAERDQQAWPPLRAGMFGGSYERLAKALEIAASMVGRMGH